MPQQNFCAAQPCGSPPKQEVKQKQRDRYEYVLKARTDPNIFTAELIPDLGFRGHTYTSIRKYSRSLDLCTVRRKPATRFWHIFDPGQITDLPKNS